MKAAPYQLLPALSADEIAALEASIVEHGVLVPVEYDEVGQIIDGHHRVTICERLGLADWPRFVRKGLTEADKRRLARELNLQRRHMSTVAKQAVIDDQLRETPSISSRAIAAMLGVDHKTVSAARKRLVDGGEIPHHDEIEGKDGVKQPARKTIRTAFLPDAENRRELLKVAKGLRAADQTARHTIRLAHMEMVAERGQDSAPGELGRAYPVYYADPPWRFGAWSEATGHNKSAENHYPTMSTDEICALMAGLTAGDHPAVLFLWATNPMLPDALAVLEAGGFAYVHHWMWDKEVAGTGYWGRDRHELLLIGRRGDVAAPLPGTQPETVHREKKTKHSAKPAEFAERIERLYPGVAKVELFARQARPGWDVWGFEADSDQSKPNAPTSSRAQSGEAGAAPPPAVPASAPGVPADLMPGDHLTELWIGGMRKNGSGRIAFSKTPDGFAWSHNLELKGVADISAPAGKPYSDFRHCVAEALEYCGLIFDRWATYTSSTFKDKHRAAAKAASVWCAEKRAEWDLGEAVP